MRDRSRPRRITIRTTDLPAFSLLETLMVLGIIVCLAGIAAPRFGRAYHQYGLDLAVRRLTADLDRARLQACHSSNTQTILFLTDSDRYSLEGLSDLDHPGRDYTVVLSDTPYSADLVQVDFKNTEGYIENQRLYFDMWGIPQCGNPSGGIPLAPITVGSIILKTGSLTRNVTISPYTGMVNIQ